MLKRRIDIRNTSVCVWESSGTEGAPVFFCHGNSSSAASFEAILRGPLGREYRMIAIDFPGHGESAPAANPSAAYSMPGLAACVSEVIAQFRFEHYWLCGHSLGGHVMTELVPDLPRALGLMLVSAPPISMGTLATTFLPDPTGGCLFKGPLDAGEAVRFADCLAARTRVAPGTFDALVSAIARTDPRFRPELGASIGRGELRSEIAILAESKLPIALCRGALDPFLSSTPYSELRCPTLWGGRVWTFDDVGHSVHLEAPEQFERLLAQFLSQHAP